MFNLKYIRGNRYGILIQDLPNKNHRMIRFDEQLRGIEYFNARNECGTIEYVEMLKEEVEYMKAQDTSNLYCGEQDAMGDAIDWRESEIQNSKMERYK